MTRIALLGVLGVLAVALAGCKVRNELSCEDPANADRPACTGVDAQETCTGTADCSVGVCKLPDGLCVECVADTDCTAAAKPVCNAMNTCEACTTHDQCGSKACNFATGECFPETDVAYVDAAGTGDTPDQCLRANPCNTLDKAMATDKPIIKFQGTDPVLVDSEQQVTHDVSILADRGARLQRMSSVGPAITVGGGRTVTIQDLEIRGTDDGLAATGATVTLDHVIVLSNPNRGLTATNSQLVIRRSILAFNTGGGLSIADSTFDISNSLIVANGSNSSAFGGARFTGIQSGSSFRFNSVADNDSDVAAIAIRGVSCEIGFSATSNIVTNNALSGGCMFDHSLFDNSTATLPSGEGNLVGDPRFDQTQLSAARDLRFYRIKDASDAIDHADPGATEKFDIDGDPRPAGRADIGADEH